MSEYLAIIIVLALVIWTVYVDRKSSNDLLDEGNLDRYSDKGVNTLIIVWVLSFIVITILGAETYALKWMVELSYPEGIEYNMNDYSRWDRYITFVFTSFMIHFVIAILLFLMKK